MLLYFLLGVMIGSASTIIIRRLYLSWRNRSHLRAEHTPHVNLDDKDLHVFNVMVRVHRIMPPLLLIYDRNKLVIKSSGLPVCLYPHHSLEDYMKATYTGDLSHNVRSRLAGAAKQSIAFSQEFKFNGQAAKLYFKVI